MTAIFNGQFKLKLHTGKNFFHLVKVENGLDASKANEVAAALVALMLSDEHKSVGLDRWSVFFRGESEKLVEKDFVDADKWPKSAIIKHDVAIKLLERAKKWKASIEKGGWGKPRLTFVDPTKPVEGKSSVNVTISIEDVLAKLSS